jgi:hypothetical protein
MFPIRYFVLIPEEDPTPEDAASFLKSALETIGPGFQLDKQFCDYWDFRVTRFLCFLPAEGPNDNERLYVLLVAPSRTARGAGITNLPQRISISSLRPRRRS